jgi:hypothetical protein
MVSGQRNEFQLARKKKTASVAMASFASATPPVARQAAAMTTAES